MLRFLLYGVWVGGKGWAWIEPTPCMLRQTAPTPSVWCVVYALARSGQPMHACSDAQTADSNPFVRTRAVDPDVENARAEEHPAQRAHNHLGVVGFRSISGLGGWSVGRWSVVVGVGWVVTMVWIGGWSLMGGWAGRSWEGAAAQPDSQTASHRLMIDPPGYTHCAAAGCMLHTHTPTPHPAICMSASSPSPPLPLSLSPASAACAQSC